MADQASARPPRYADPEYQAAHDTLFKYLLDPDIETVLPPGVTKDDFTSAIQDLVQALGEEAVITGPGLREYVDPYDIPESGQRTVPSAAVWYVTWKTILDHRMNDSFLTDNMTAARPRLNKSKQSSESQTST